MKNVDKLIVKSEELYKKNGTISALRILLQRYLIDYIIGKNAAILNKAVRISNEAFNQNNKSIELLFYSIYFNIELGNYKEARNKLEAMDKYKRYMKNNDTNYYAFYIYLSALIEVKTSNSRHAWKYMRMLEEINEDSEHVNVYAGLLLANLGMDLFASSKKIAEYISNSYGRNNRSAFFFLTLYRYFNMKNTKIYHTELLVPFLNWCVAHGADVYDIIEIYSDKIIFSLFDNSKLKTRLYKKYSNNYILRQICRMLMSDMDLSLDAFYFYNEAINKQIELTGLFEFLIKAAHKNSIETIGIYPVSEFLSENKLNSELKPFIYHLILSDKKYKHLVLKFEEDIIKFGMDCFEKGLEGRWYYTIYNFVSQKEESEAVINKIYERIDSLLYEKAFLYEVSLENKKVSYIRIIEKEKNNIEVFPVEDGKAIIKAVSDNFSYYLFDALQKEILTGDITYKRLVTGADYKLFVKIYNKGMDDDYVLISLAKRIISLESLDKSFILILDKAVKLKNISREFKMKLFLKMANIYYNEAELENAVKYYKEIDLNLLNEKNIDEIMKAFLSTGQIESAVGILVKKAHCLTDKTLYLAVKQASKEKKYHKKISNFAYELLLKSWYDRNFINIIIENYQGSLEEWKQLNIVLHEMNAPEQIVDEKILENSVHMGILDEYVQSIFVDVYESEQESIMIEPFINYCCYQIIVNGRKIEKILLNLLEKIFLKAKIEHLAYALGYVYINQEMATANSAEIIKCIVELVKDNNRAFELFEKSKDNNFHSSYIAKNKAFIYRTSPELNVFLFYRFADNEEFKKIKMKYFKYGLYMINIPLFFGEVIEYYFCEQMENGSIETMRKKANNENIKLYEEASDSFFKINNALIYDKMFKYEHVEDIISDKLKKDIKIKGQLL